MHIANEFIRRADAVSPSDDMASVTLTLAQRRRSRQRLSLDGSGEPLAMAIARGHTLHDGDLLITLDGRRIVVRAALESVARVTANSPQQLARAAYHLGNRHILLEVGEGCLQLEYDPVLVEMLAQLGGGLTVKAMQAVFEPEVGAYGGGHRHGHDESFDEDYALAQAAYHSHDSR